MPIWPFRKRPRSEMKEGPRFSQILSEKTPLHPHASSTAHTAATSPAPPSIPRRLSLRDLNNTRAASSRDDSDEKKDIEALGKENVPTSPSPQRRESREDITALPMSRQLQHSPHLRPVDLERPHIPYNFRPYSTSQTSLQRDEATALPNRPRTLRSRRSNFENSTPQRRRSSRRGKTDHVREEEIRAMSSPVSVPKRPGDGPLRRESKKVRSIGAKDSTVSLPPEESTHTAMFGIMEHRGWDIGSLDVFNPRPSVRLSATPQYITPGSVPSTSYTTNTEGGLKREKEKMPVSRDSARKRDTIGASADALDASDLRLLLERDAKRREQRKKDQQEKLDRKLRSRGGRNRGDSDRKRREAEEEQRVEEQRRLEDERRVEEKRRLEEGERVESARRRAGEESARQRLMTPPTDIHPALRDTPTIEKPEMAGLGIAEESAVVGAARPEEESRQPENPFTDDAMVQEEAAIERPEPTPYPPGAFTPAETPMEDPVVSTAQEVRMSQTATPPLSPIRASRLSPPPSSSLNQVMDQRRASELPPPPPLSIEERRASDPKPERRAGAWATFFRRGGTSLRRPADDDPKSGTSFSNTSRESMRNQPIPAHLIDTQAVYTPKARSKSGTPVRTQSKFREDLPELPLSPPDSRVASPDVTTAAAAAALARRQKLSSPSSSQPVDIPNHDSSTHATPEPASSLINNRNDTPVSPHRPGHGLMSASLASIGSEGSWLASGNSTKRLSTQSGLRRSIGSLSKRPADFTASYEELGGDKDAEYFRQRKTEPSSPERSGFQQRGRPLSTALGGGATSATSPDEESQHGDDHIHQDEDEAGGAAGEPPFTVHDSLRRHPTLVHRDPRLRSREGLLVQIPTSDPSSSTFSNHHPIAQLPSAVSATSAGTGGTGTEGSPVDFGPDTPEPELVSATSVNYGSAGGGRGHTRQVSAGSARLLDVKRSSLMAVGNNKDVVVGEGQSGPIVPGRLLNQAGHEEGEADVGAGAGARD